MPGPIVWTVVNIDCIVYIELWMGTKPILNFVIDPALLRRLDDFWHDNRFPTRAEAVRWLIQAALNKKLAPKAAGGKKGI
jgi:hypothetical protein